MLKSANFLPWKLKLILLLCVIGSGSFSHAEEKKKGIVDNMVEYNRYLSEKFDGAATEVDYFLAGKKYTRKKNSSSFTIRAFGSHAEGGEKKTSANFDVDIRLPNVEEKWQLSFTSYDEDAESRGVRSQQQRTTDRERNYGTGLALFQEIGKIRTTFRPRIAIKDPLQTSYTLRFERNTEPQPMKLDPRVEFFADSVKGTGQFVSLNLEVSRSNSYSLVFFNEEQYQEATNLFQTTHGLSIARPVGKRMSVNHTVSFLNNNKTTYHLEDFVASFGFTHEPLRRIFRYYVTPYWSFTKTRHFKGSVGISLETQIVF